MNSKLHMFTFFCNIHTTFGFHRMTLRFQHSGSVFNVVRNTVVSLPRRCFTTCCFSSHSHCYILIQTSRFPAWHIIKAVIAVQIPAQPNPCDGFRLISAWISVKKRNKKQRELNLPVQFIKKKKEGISGHDEIILFLCYIYN